MFHPRVEPGRSHQGHPGVYSIHPKSCYFTSGTEIIVTNAFVPTASALFEGAGGGEWGGGM